MLLLSIITSASGHHEGSQQVDIMLTHTQESESNVKKESLMLCQMWNRLASDGKTLHFFPFL